MRKGHLLLRNTLANQHPRQPQRQGLMVGLRATLHPHPAEPPASHPHHHADRHPNTSTFQQLKREVQELENSQILGIRHRLKTEPDRREPEQLTAASPLPLRKQTLGQRCKIPIRKGRNRKVSLILQNSKGINVENVLLQSLRLKECEWVREVSAKKKQTPNIVRKYFRPLTCNNRAIEEYSRKENEIRGHRLRSSHSHRNDKEREKDKDKENLLIYCY